ncbi:MAG TPA: AIR synthase-related protein [Spirochaetia bacterium]|nr:AIR synthase-related protein [Spirochaetia bacterium]
MVKDVLREGKLPPEELAPLLAMTSRGSEISVEAAVGEDAAVVTGARTIVLTADPITFTEENIGIYTVAVNCNDIVAMGGEPKYLTTTFLLPPGTTRTQLRNVFADIANASDRAGILWVGGHTEVTSAVNRIVVSGHGVGFLDGNPLTTAGAQPGDSLVMTKWAALEGTTIIARTFPEGARDLLGRESWKRVSGWLVEPGISIIQEGRILRHLSLTSAHDPTEGGVATGIHEIAKRSGVGVEIEFDRITIREETETLCRRWGLDPLGLLSSGVFLFTAPPAVAEKACSLLSEGGIPASIIGRITERRGDVTLLKGKQMEPLPFFVADEYLKIGQGSK